MATQNATAGDDVARTREALDRIATVIETETHGLPADSAFRADFERLVATIRECVPRRGEDAR